MPVMLVSGLGFEEQESSPPEDSATWRKPRLEDDRAYSSGGFHECGILLPLLSTQKGAG